MKFSFAAIVATLAVASAQTVGEVPSCALPCLLNSIKKVTTCAETDFKCACKSFSKIQIDATGCIVGACGISDAINKVLPAVKALCDANS